MADILGDFFKGFFGNPQLQPDAPEPVEALQPNDKEIDVILVDVKKTIEDEETSCPVCFDKYASPGSKEPVTTECGHTLCRECFQMLPLDADRFKHCPHCRSEVHPIDNPSHTVLVTQLIDKYNHAADQLQKLLRVVKNPNLEAEITNRLQEAHETTMMERLERLKNQLEQERMVAIQAAVHDVGELLHAENSKLTLEKEALESRLAMYNVIKDASGEDLVIVVNKLQEQLMIERQKLETTRNGLKLELDALRRLVAANESHRETEIDQISNLKQQVADLQREIAKRDIQKVVGDNESYVREMKTMRERLAEVEIINESKSRYINDLKAEVLKLKNGGSDYQVARQMHDAWNNGGNDNNWGGNYGNRDEGTQGRTGKFFTHKNS